MSDPYDRYLDDFGARLHAAASGRVSASRPRRRLALGALIATAAVAVAFVLVLAGSPAGRPLDVVAEARAALAPPGEIVYLRITTSSSAVGPGGIKGTKPPSSTTEQWTAADPPRWRLVQTIPRDRRNGTVSDGDGRRIVGRQEFAYAAGRQSDFSVELNRLVVNTGYSDDGLAARSPGPFGGDPATDLRAMLAERKVTDAGLVDVGGRTVRRLISESSGPGKPTRRLIYDVDPETFAPVRGVLRFGFPASTRSAVVVAVTFTVNRYERLPVNAQTAKLLTIATNARTKVTIITPEARRRLLREREKGCRRAAEGGRICPLRRARRP